MAKAFEYPGPHPGPDLGTGSHPEPRPCSGLSPSLGPHRRRAVRRWVAAAVLVVGAAAPAAAGAEALPLAGEVETAEVAYTCTGAVASLGVRYVNAGAQSFAVVPLDGLERIFVTVLSASGARYASGPYVWWSARGGADLYDLRLGEDADPVARCTEAP